MHQHVKALPCGSDEWLGRLSRCRLHSCVFYMTTAGLASHRENEPSSQAQSMAQRRENREGLEVSKARDSRKAVAAVKAACPSCQEPWRCRSRGAICAPVRTSHELTALLSSIWVESFLLCADLSGADRFCLHLPRSHSKPGLSELAPPGCKFLRERLGVT